MEMLVKRYRNSTLLTSTVFADTVSLQIGLLGWEYLILVGVEIGSPDVQCVLQQCNTVY